MNDLQERVVQRLIELGKTFALIALFVLALAFAGDWARALASHGS
jgi:hypothetical protein